MKTDKLDIIAFIAEGGYTTVGEVQKAFQDKNGIKLKYSDVYVCLKNKDKIIESSKPSGASPENTDIETREDRGGITYFVFKEESPMLSPSQKGARIEVAGMEEYFELLKVHYKGEPQWPNANGYTVRDSNGTTRCFEQAQCRLAKNQSKKA